MRLLEHGYIVIFYYAICWLAVQVLYLATVLSIMAECIFFKYPDIWQLNKTLVPDAVMYHSNWGKV